MSKTITLAHGSGGQTTRDFIEQTLLPRFSNPALDQLGDAAGLELDGSRLLFTTDSFVIDPIEFPGGDIGNLAVCGTVNDLAVAGGRPLWLSCGLIVEEGLDMGLLERVLDSIARTAESAGVQVVCGDTKVVGHGGADRIFINTSGIGVPIDDYRPSRIRPGDKVLVNGTIGDHETAIFRVREGLARDLDLASDCAPLNSLVADMLSAAPGVRVMRDPTRGGLGTVLNELVEGSGCSLTVDDEALPIREDVQGICDIVGFDPLYLANEGKVVAIAPSDQADALLAAMRRHPHGENAAIIGAAVADEHERVYLETGFGGTRIVNVPAGMQLPRIC